MISLTFIILITVKFTDLKFETERITILAPISKIQMGKPTINLVQEVRVCENVHRVSVIDNDDLDLK